MIDFIKEYIDNRFQLIKLGLVSVLANLTARLISSFLIVIMALIIMLMFSISLSFYIGSLLDNNIALGFTIVGGIYTLFFIIYFIFMKKRIDLLVKNKIVQAAFAAEKEITDESLNNNYE